jgi:EAL domain-containing protein (putative c-di-GMP-specific phosphodiesterase class I)/GGDEF domain-containing protein
MFRRFLHHGLADARRGDGLVFGPPLMLAAYWLAGEVALVCLAVALPLLWWRPAASVPAPAPDAGFGDADDLLAFLDRASDGAAAFVVALDDGLIWPDRQSGDALSRLPARIAERLCHVLRAGDLVVLLPGRRIGLGLVAPPRMNAEAAMHLAARLQSAASVPIREGGEARPVSVSIGFCLGDQALLPGGRGILEGAETALEEALLHGPGAIRAFDPAMTRRRADRAALRADLARALDEGQIRPWFQPQICADTGAVTGMEALARWHHPEKGVVPPSDFLPAVHQQGLSQRLGEVILQGALSALSRWDRAGLSVPRVAVNLSGAELRSPDLAERVIRELDRFGLAPSRLTVEVLETVPVGAGDEGIAANLACLARLGLGIDLDDFGTGQASIAHLRRFCIRRVKIDRGFVTGVDHDADQKRVVSGILMLCDRLGLETVAEGVETPGEHATLAQLGCTHLQGFGIARPMAVEETFGWLARRASGVPVGPPLPFGRPAGKAQGR